MGSSDEMYRRGATDAEQNDLNHFYYQHYYHYRRGYDETRRRQRRVEPVVRKPPPRSLWLVGLLVLAVLAGALLWSQLSPPPAPSSAQSTAGPAAAARPGAGTVPPTSVPATPTVVPTATPAPGLRIGARARVVNLSGGPLRVRREPGLQQPITARMPEGTEVTVVDGPIAADGYTWWRIEDGSSSGWSAERSAEGVVWLEPVTSDE